MTQSTHTSIPKLPRLQALAKILHPNKLFHLLVYHTPNNQIKPTKSKPLPPKYCPLPHPVPTKNKIYVLELVTLAVALH